MNKVTCIRCSHFSLCDPRFNDAKALKTRSEMVKHGFGNCAVQPIYRFMSPAWPRECDQHQPVSQAEMPARLAWLESLR